MQLGTDPEFFVLGPMHQPVPAHKFFPPKEKKMKIEGWDHLSIYRDGYVVEINYDGPAPYCREGLCGYINGAIEGVSRILPKGHRLESYPTAYIQLGDMEKAPEDVKMFGCSPAMDAYTGRETSVNIDAVNHPYRYAGGHLHFSTDPKGLREYDRNNSEVQFLDVLHDHEKLCMLVKMLDLFVGVPLTYLLNDRNTFVRRILYGKAGEFRLQNYPNGGIGVEYRTPDARVWNHPRYASLALGVGRWVCLNFKKLLGMWDPHIEAYVQQAINTGVGLPNLIQTLPSWYNKKLLDHAIKVYGQDRLNLITQTSLRAPHDGWYNFSRVWPEVYSISEGAMLQSIVNPFKR